MIFVPKLRHAHGALVCVAGTVLINLLIIGQLHYNIEKCNFMLVSPTLVIPNPASDNVQIRLPAY